jgi:hypothetical protein
LADLIAIRADERGIICQLALDLDRARGFKTRPLDTRRTNRGLLSLSPQ